MTLKIMVKDLMQGRPGSVLFRFTLPVLSGNLFQLFYTLADTVIVGRTLGENALAAVGSTSINIYIVLCFIQGFTGGFGICLGQRFGAKDEDGMRRSAGISWLLSLFFTIVLTLAGCLLAHPILYWMQTPQDIYDDAYTYLFLILLGTGATIFYNIVSNLLRAGRQQNAADLPGDFVAGQRGPGYPVHRAAAHGRCGRCLGHSAQPAALRICLRTGGLSPLSRAAQRLPYEEKLLL